MSLRLWNTDELIILMHCTDKAEPGKVSLVGCQRSHDPERGIPDPETDLLVDLCICYVIMNLIPAWRILWDFHDFLDANRTLCLVSKVSRMRRGRGLFHFIWHEVIAYIHVLCVGAMPHNRLWDLVDMYMLTQINICANCYNGAYAHTHVRSSLMHACLHDDVMQWKQFLHYPPFVRESETNCWIPFTKGRWYELFMFFMFIWC